ncbi:hypothetical protein FHS78_003182 [Parvibaculum indicum]|uniref:hypothetical protein n=1 Tax=Parvibaculum indicum TaxID=562969 RepID=UPI00141E2544|nr:hypothetical protein [Parvibaculum indicum]NIJ42874.1 hypothetical protein [Parvibaculum indicum]
MNRILLGCAIAVLAAGCVDTGTLVLPSAYRSSTPQEPAPPSPGLGLAGQDGAVTALVGDDLLGTTLGTEGTVNALLGGTNAMSEQLDADSLPQQPLGDILAQAGDSLNAQLAGLADPGLGASGEDSPVTQLMGGDLVGTLIGTEEGAVPVFVAGTDGGVLGMALSPVTGSLPEGASLAPVTTPLIEALSTVQFPDTSGSGDSGGNGLAPLTDALTDALAGLAGGS